MYVTGRSENMDCSYPPSQTINAIPGISGGQYTYIFHESEANILP